MTDLLNEDAPLQSEQGEIKQEVKPEDPSERLTPEHPRFKQVYAEAKAAKEQVSFLEQQINELRESINSRNAPPDDDLTAEEQAALERINKYFKKSGYITKEELQQTINVELSTDRRSREYMRLSDKYNGGNGLPKFVPEDVQEYAKRKGYGDLEEAYKSMHFDTLVEIEAKKRSMNFVPSSEKPVGGSREALGTDLSREKIASMSPAEYAKNREKIHNWMKSNAR